jgi:hypothetical protein
MVIEEPHCEVNVTLNGPRNVFFDEIEKLEPVETVCEVGEISKLEGYDTTTRVGLLMLTSTLPVAPPFFFIDTLDVLTWILQVGGPESPPTPPPERSMQGVLSDTVRPPTTARLSMLSDELIVLL